MTMNTNIKKKIDIIVNKAVKEKWYDEMTTSDLQGAVMAQVMMKITRNNTEMMDYCDIILNKIYLKKHNKE